MMGLSAHSTHWQLPTRAALLALVALSVQDAVHAWHNPWDILPHAYPNTNQCKIPRGASARTDQYSYDLNPEWGTLSFLPEAVAAFSQKGGSRGGSDWNRFCGDMYSSYMSGEVHGGKGSICGKPWKLWWAADVPATRAAFWTSDFERQPDDEQYFMNWNTKSYWTQQGMAKYNGKLRLRANSLNCKQIAGYDSQSRYLGPMAPENSDTWTQPPGYRYEDQTDLLMTLVSCVQPCMENVTASCCTVPNAIATLFPCCSAAGCCALKTAGRRRAFGAIYRKNHSKSDMVTKHPTVAINVQAGAASRRVFNNLLAQLRKGTSLKSIVAGGAHSGQ